MATRFSTRSIAGGKETSILVVVLETSEVYIIISLCTRNDTQVIHVDPTTGSLCYQGKFGHDLFSSEEEALNYITDGSRWLCKSTTYARAILGYSALGSFGLLLVATRLTVTIPNLPGGGCVYTVAESQWIKIQLQNPQPQGKGELKNIQELAELDIDGKHFFCDTRDITRPFPSHMPFQNPDDEFVWNLWLSKPFKDIGLPAHCVILLQGFAECRSFGGSAQQVCSVALIARRSRLHPGTRYLARGLNACSSTGNEVECEQLVWVSGGTGQNVPFSTYVWRRGTIPIWWGAELKLTAAEAEIYVSAQDPYRGSLQYYQRLSQRYAARNLDSTIASQRKTPSVPIVCVNLLRSGEGKAEAILVEHFRESIKYVKSTGKLRNTLIQLINYDWHAIVKSSGEQQTIEGLWKILKAPTIIIGFSDGSYIPSLQQLREYKGAVISNDDIQGGFCLKSFQNGVIRFNCADSLDRTNAASYFGCLQVFVEQCKRLGISLDIDAIYGFPSLNKSADWGSFGGYSSLPPGWEERSDAVTGKVYYIDHNTRTTTWEHPCQDKPWKRFDMTFDQFKSSTTLAPINQLADLFLLAGDIHATLYTGSKAMHSQILNIFSEESGKFRQFSVALNVGITLQRRYKNVVVDSSRQKQLEMFLGIRLFKHLPSVSIHPLKVVSRPSGCLLKPIESMFPAADGGSSLLSFKRKDIIWVCPSDANVVEVFIYLGEPCHVCQLLLTVSHGADDSSYPATVDVRTGCSLDGLKLVLESACIPQCLNGTNISIPLTGRINPEDSAITGTSSRIHGQDNYLPFLYDFEELEGELNFLTRVVALTFYPSVSGITPLTLGEIEILGMPLPWMDIFNNKGSGAKYLELIQKKTQQSNPFLSDSSTNDSTNPLFSDLHGSHFYDAPSNENTLQGAVPGAISHGIDLLTGDLSFSQPLSKQEVPRTAESTGFRDEGQIDFFDSSIADPVFQAAPVLPFHSQEETHKELSGTQQYIKFVKSLSGSHKHQKIDFLEAIILEIERLRLNLSAAERDRALLSISIDPATIDPNRLVDESYMVKLCNYVTSLTILGQTAYEDQINASIGLQSEKNNVIDFWNVTKIGETCSGTMCEVRAEIQPSGKTSPSASCGSPLLLVCSQCGRKACKVCCAGKGAGLLLSNSYKETKKYNGLMSQSGSTHGQQSEKTSISHSNLLDGVICKLCCSEIIVHALYVDYVRVLCSLRRGSRTDNAAYKALNEVLGQDGNSISDIWEGTKIEKRLLKQLFNSEESLAEFPYAGFLHMIETSAGSEPLLSLLAPLGIGRRNSYWHAPPGVSTVEFSIVLGSLSDVSGVALLVSSCGYSASDCPIVQIWASNKINREERSCMGKWDIQSLIASSPHLFGPEKSASEQDVPRHVKFLFRNPMRCQIIWIALTLPQPNLSSSILEKEYNLLSLDESAISLSDHQAPGSTAVRRDPCIHAKRLLVFGKSVRKVISSDASILGPERMKMKAFMDRSPQLNRFRVPIEAERLTDNDLVLEQYLSPTVPVAGFRLDSFSVIKPRITHSPSSLDVDLWESSLTCLEDRHIMPAILHIQVSVVQEPKSLVTIGEYRLPEVKAGTALYFDFPRPIQAGRVIFRLLGDVTAFADDVSEQDDSEFRSLLASGLSLSNRIKLYYYADPYELGKIASLSAV